MLDQNTVKTTNDKVGAKTSAFIYEDDQCVAFDEQFSPQAVVHFLVVPKKMIKHFRIATGDDEQIIGHLLIVAKKIALDKGLNKNGYHVVVDEDPKTLRFKCLHVFGRSLQHMLWPTGPGCRL